MIHHYSRAVNVRAVSSPASPEPARCPGCFHWVLQLVNLHGWALCQSCNFVLSDEQQPEWVMRIIANAESYTGSNSHE